MNIPILAATLQVTSGALHYSVAEGNTKPPNLRSVKIRHKAVRRILFNNLMAGGANDEGKPVFAIVGQNLCCCRSKLLLLEA